MVKFADADEPNYKRVKQAIKEIITDRIEKSEQGCNQSDFLELLDGPPMYKKKSRQDLLTFQQQEPMGFGRVDTIGTQKLDEWLHEQKSTQRVLNDECSGQSVEQNRRSPTTLGDVGLGSNRSSQSSGRLLIVPERPLPPSDAQFREFIAIDVVRDR